MLLLKYNSNWPHLGYCTEEPLTSHGCQLVDRLLVVLFLILPRFIRKNNNCGAKMPYVTNPYLISHHGAAVTHQIFWTMETGWNQTQTLTGPVLQTLDECFKHTSSAATVHLVRYTEGQRPLRVLHLTTRAYSWPLCNQASWNAHLYSNKHINAHERLITHALQSSLVILQHWILCSKLSIKLKGIIYGKEEELKQVWGSFKSRKHAVVEWDRFCPTSPFWSKPATAPCFSSLRV